MKAVCIALVALCIASLIGGAGYLFGNAAGHFFRTIASGF